MRRLVEDTTFHDRIEEAIDTVEQRTSAEVVVVLASSSGSYRDIDLGIAATLALVVLATMILVPFPIHELVALPATVLAFVGAALASRNIPRLRQLVVGARRRHVQVLEQARVAFHEEGVRATRERNGLLIYVSLEEQHVEFLPDLGIEGHVAGAEWNRLQHDILTADDTAGALIAAIEATGERLSAPFPPGDDNPDEIPNRPRLRTG